MRLDGDQEASYDYPFVGIADWLWKVQVCQAVVRPLSEYVEISEASITDLAGLYTLLISSPRPYYCEIERVAMVYDQSAYWL